MTVRRRTNRAHCSYASAALQAPADLKRSVAATTRESSHLEADYYVLIDEQRTAQAHRLPRRPLMVSGLPGSVPWATTSVRTSARVFEREMLARSRAHLCPASDGGQSMRRQLALTAEDHDGSASFRCPNTLIPPWPRSGAAKWLGCGMIGERVPQAEWGCIL